MFGYIPVYFSLQDIDGDFQCKANSLFLGGGSGEHPVLVLLNPLSAVAWFLDEEIDDLELSDDEKSSWKKVYRKHLDWDLENNLKFYEWNIETSHNFFKMCKKGSLPNSYYSESNSLENWLLLGFGEFIFFAMPELADEIVSELNTPYEKFAHMRYNNIMLIPPNIPVYANGGNAFVSSPRKHT